MLEEAGGASTAPADHDAAACACSGSTSHQHHGSGFHGRLHGKGWLRPRLLRLDSYELDSAATATLDSQAAWITQYPQVRITVEGHADERGPREYKDRKSIRLNTSH